MAAFPQVDFQTPAPLFPSVDLQDTHKGRLLVRILDGDPTGCYNITDKTTTTDNDQSWLHNPSFRPPSESDHQDSSDSVSSDYTLSPEPKQVKKPPSKKPKPEPVGEKDVYRIDLRSDPGNLRYDSVYRGDVSLYRRKFDCLGLKTSQKLKWTDGRSKPIRKKMKFAGNVRYFADRSKPTSSEVCIPSKATNPATKHLPDFIMVESNPVAIKTETPGDVTAERYMSQLTGDYNSSLLEQPHNVTLWLEFLAFQDQLLEWGHLPGESTENMARKKRALTERKISIYERALKLNPMSEELLVGHMKLIQEIWSTDKTIKKWKDIVFHQPNKPLLWLNYIHFCQNNFSSFGTSSIISLYKKCITTLSSILQGTLKSHLPLPNTSSYLVAIFSLYCNFLKQVGLTERAVACYQALLEFNLCPPLDLDEDERLMKEFFEPFWDSGSPRFGEPSAVGWCNWTKKNSDESKTVELLGLLSPTTGQLETEKMSAANEEDAELKLISGLSLAMAWLELEDYRRINNCFPWQPETRDLSAHGDEEDCSDPDRVVMFDDVSQTLFRIMDPELKLKLLLSFLSLLGAPVNPPFQSLVSKVTNLQSIDEVSPNCLSLLETQWKEETVGYDILPDGLGLPFSLSSGPSLADFASFLSKQMLSTRFVPKSTRRTSSLCNFISNVCNHSLSVFSSPQHQTRIAQVWVSSLFSQMICSSQSSTEIPPKINLKAQIRSIQKLMKSLLRLDQHRNNLTLWNFSALFEYSVGNFKESKTLFELILAHHPTPNPILCSTLSECFMGLQKSLWNDIEVDTHLVLHALVCFAEGRSTSPGTSISPARIHKANLHFSQESVLSLNDNLEEKVASILCHGYFKYLTHGMKESLQVFQKWESDLELGLKEEQDRTRRDSFLLCLNKVYKKKLQLLEHHSLTSPLQPSIIRSVIGKAMDAFPNDQVFMSAFIRSEQQTFISGRMRRHFDRISSKSDTPIPWLFTVVSELDRYIRVTDRLGGQVEETSVGTVNRIMGILSRVAVSENAIHCPLFWRIYMTIQVSLSRTLYVALYPTFYTGLL